eukprot:gene6723-6942_t
MPTACQVVRQAYSKDDLTAAHGLQQCCVAAVLDGHGMLGELVAQEAGQTVVQDICNRAQQNGRNLLSQPADKLANTLTVCDRLLECGTTCTVAVVQGDQVCLAHVGDTAAALVSLSDDDVVARFVTVNHNGRNQDEAHRIASRHGCMSRISEDRGYLSTFAGMWAGFELSVTRALGHKYLEAYGVLCQPTVTKFELQPDDTCLIIASDGVWDVMDAREAAHRVMDVLSGGGSAEDAARQLVQDTVMLGECSPDGDVDNTSAVVVVFE